MTTLGFALLLGSIHASVVALVTIIARRCLPVRMAAGRVTIGAVGMACVLVVTGLALLPLPGLWPGEASDAAPRLSPAKPTEVANSSQEDAQHSPAATPPASGDVAADAGPVVEMPVTWLRRLRRITERSAPVSHAWRNVAVAILLSGSGIGLLRLLFAMRSVARLRRSSTLVTNHTIVAMINRLTERCACRRTIEVRETAQLASAAASGWSRPVILLPSDWPQWSQEELTSVLAHEVAHVHRADYARRVVAFTSMAVHFYHPLLRVIARRLVADQEFAADRMARTLVDDARSYTRGLARLALRYHESLSDRPGWSSVSIMPGSSDFLARRLEMLRLKELMPGKPTRTIAPYAVSAGVVVLALATALLRGAAAADDNRKAASASIAETARLPSEEHKLAPATSTPAAEQALFGRPDFNPSTIGLGPSGGFLIRVGDFLRHPEIQPHVDSLNERLKTLLGEIIGDSAKTFDIREIEWIAGDLMIKAKPPRDPMQNGQLTFGSGRIVIRTTHMANWRKIVLDAFPGSTLEHFEGRPYVQFPSLPAFGPAPLRMRSPDPRTLIYRVGTKPDPQANEDDEEKLLRKFFDDTPTACPWAGAWRAVDGGLVTVVFDNSAVGWPELAAAREDYPELIEPLARKTKFVALGGDWTEVENRTGVRLRATCEDRESVREIHLASMTLLSFWPGLVLEGGDAMAQYQKRILQFFSSVEVQPSPAGSDQHFVHGTAEVTWDPHEFAKVLGLSGEWALAPGE